MADYNAQVALGVNAPDPNQGLTTLNKIMSLGQQGLAIQGQKSQNQSLAAEATKNTIDAQQAQGVNQFFSQWNPGDHHGEDGTIDLDSAHASDAYKALPGVARIAVDMKINDMRGQQLKNKQALTSLNGEVVGQFGKLAQAAAEEKDPQVRDAMLNAFAAQGPDNARILQLYRPLLGQVPPEKQPGALKTMAAQAQDVSAQQAQTNPAQLAVNTGGATQVYNVDKSTGLQPGQQPAQTLTNTLSPQVITMPDSTLRTVGGAYGAPPGGGVGGASNAPNQPRTAIQDAPPANSPKAVIDAYNTAIQQANNHVEAVRTADENYGNNKAISQAIRQLSSGADTGPGTQTWNHVMGILGTEKSNNYQELGAFLDRQAATVRGQMGLPGTNAGAEDAKMIAGNTQYNAKVIQDKNNYTEALTEGLHQYRNGLDRVAGFSGQASPQAVSKFKSEWTQNFDPNVYIGEMAYKRSKAEGEAFVRSLPPAEAGSLAAKRKALQELSKGQLPQ